MRLTSLSLAVSLAVMTLPAWSAQELQGPTPPQPLPTDPSVVPQANVPAPAVPASASSAGSSLRAQIRQLKLQGCVTLSCEALQAQVEPLPAEPMSLPDIEQLAQRVTLLYRRAGYPFAQVLVPPQRLTDGVLTLRVVEGVLGATQVTGNDPMSPDAQPFLDAGLPLGQPIHEVALERTMLLIDDQPGFSLRPVLKPGRSSGEGDLMVQVDRVNHVSGDTGVDNLGSRSTGRNRLKGSLAFNSPFSFGDRLALNALTTDQDMWLGSADYDRPLGPYGPRVLAGWARTSYRLGGAFAALQASGYAETTTLKFSYPLVRSQRTNLQLALTVQHKDLQDRYDSVSLVRAKSSDGATLSAQFDLRDGWMGGGVTYGLVSLNQGHLHLDADARSLDAKTAQTAGDYTKINLDVARIQRVLGNWSLYGRVSAQWSNKNLDSSEKYGIGGFLGVRAYPMGEGTGDRGWLTQAELRYSADEFTPFLLADAGRMSLNSQPWDAGSRARRSIAGLGLGVRWNHAGWSLESALAHRVIGGRSQSESPDNPMRLWVTLSHRFH